DARDDLARETLGAELLGERRVEDDDADATARGGEALARLDRDLDLFRSEVDLLAVDLDRDLAVERERRTQRCGVGLREHLLRDLHLLAELRTERAKARLE